MKKYILIALLNTGLFFSQEISIPIDTIVKTTHETLIKGKKIKYTAETGTQPVWNNDGKPIASLFYTYYKRELAKDSKTKSCLLYTSPSPRDRVRSRMPSSA